MKNEDIVNYNRKAWNKYVDEKITWSIPVSHEIVEEAKKGNWNIILTPTKPIPKKWMGGCKGKKDPLSCFRWWPTGANTGRSRC